MGRYISLSFCLFLSIYITVITARQLNIFSLDKSWICNIKKSCVDCLRLSQCSWCRSENKCFSEILPYFQSYCKDDKVQDVDYGMSLEENAKCACDPDHLSFEKNCQHPDVISEECSGRGTCVCGRCFCNNIPFPENPSKTIMGEYCEYDNFSCNDTKCTEGPYNIYELNNFDENTKYNGE
ncbi:integrin beta-like protein 1 [Pararge aegeria]|uniref:integrin beta-like protein 1 n=1 Tax=Pararge aegeria TaxID=116150 RepID=UPI0019CF81EF|nr:integrin beta-like protein 1 [Pararge aegeria]